MAIADLLVEVGIEGSVTTLSAPGKSIGVYNINVGSTANWPSSGKTVYFAMRTINPSAVTTANPSGQVAGTYSSWKGIIGTNAITSMVLQSGSTDQLYTAGSNTQVFIPVSAARENALVAWGQVHADNLGNLLPAHINTQLATTTSTQDGNTTILQQRSEYFFDYIASGGVWTADSAGTNNNASMTALVAYQGGRRITVASVTARTFTASKDTYVDILNTVGVGSIVYTESGNNGGTPALAANSIRLGIIVSGATFIANAASINQGQESSVLPIIASIALSVTDALGNLICPRDPLRKILGYKQIISTASTTNATSTQVPGLSCSVIVPTGRKVKITFGAEFFQGATATTNYFFEIWDGVVGSGSILRNGTFTTGGANFTEAGIVLAPIQTPTSSTKTYNAGFHSGSALVSVGATPNGPAFIMVELA